MFWEAGYRGGEPGAGDGGWLGILKRGFSKASEGSFNLQYGSCLRSASDEFLPYQDRLSFLQTPCETAQN